MSAQLRPNNGFSGRLGFAGPPLNRGAGLLRTSHNIRTENWFETRRNA